MIAYDSILQKKFTRPPGNENTMNAIAVIGPWRGGTSLVTAVLQALGAFVGEEFVDAETDYCTFEDLRLQKACLACFDERPGQWRYYGTQQERVEHLRDWIQWAHSKAVESGGVACGGKHPVMCKLVDELDEAWSIEGLVTPLFISVIRSPKDIHRSWTRPRGPGQSHWWPRWDRQYIVDDLIASRDVALSTRRHIQIDFDSLRRIPETTIAMLADACNLPTDHVPEAVNLVRRGQPQTS